MKSTKRKRFLKGSSLIEVLVAVVIIVIAITAIVKIIIIGGRAGRSAHHSSEALIIAQKWIEKSKASRFEDNLFFSTVWKKENDQDEYKDRPEYLSWTYWVKREERYVVLEQLTTDKSADTPYKVRLFKDVSPVDGFDEPTGQAKDLKQIIITVGWAENKLVENLNDLDTENTSWRNDVFWKEVELKTLISKQSPSETSCCDAPGVGVPEIYVTSPDEQLIEITPASETIEACTDVTIRVRVQDFCPNPKLHVVLYYIGANESDTQSVTMESMGGLGYHEALIPWEYVKNYDGACEVEDPDGNPDLKIKVIATDSYVAPECSTGTIRTSASSWVLIDIKDTSVPKINITTNSSLVEGGSGVGCHGKIEAEIEDGCNGVNGIDVGNLKVELAPMDENELYNESDLFEIPLTDQSDFTFTWAIDESYIKDYSNPDTTPGAPLDDLPDIYYRITAYDTCDQYTVVWSSMTVTPKDTKAPEFEEIYSMPSCLPWGTNITFGSKFTDECTVVSAGLYVRNRGLANTKTIPLSYSVPGLPHSSPQIYVEVTPADIDSPDDLIIQFWAEDDSNQRGESEEYIFYFEDAIAWDIDNVSSAATYGESHDTIAIIIKNMRSEPTYLGSLKLVDPTRIDIYNEAMGNTYTVIPFIDKVVIESLTDTTSSGVLWDWKTSYPSPGSRERAPVTLDFYNADIEARKLDPFERAVIRIHFLDSFNDNPIPANPIDMNNLHFEMYLIGDANFEYECKSLFDFFTVGNSCPYADAGWDQISCMTVGHPMKVGSTFYFWGGNSFDPEGDPITFTWDFGDGHTSTDVWTNHKFATTGLHKVTLKVSDGFCTSYDSIYVQVSENEPPVARMWYSPNPTGVGIPVNFDAWNSYDPNCEQWAWPVGLTYHWDFGDGDTSTNAWESHPYINTGTYTVTLTVWDSDSATDSISTDIEVLDASTCFLTNVGAWPSAWSFNGLVGTQITFWGWVGDGVSPYIFNWDFGDGDTASTEEAFHTYNSTGTFEVRFSVIDSSGCIGSTGFYLTIYDLDQMVCDFAFVCAGNREYVELNDIFVNTGFIDLESEVTGGFSGGYWFNWNIADADPNWGWEPNISDVVFLAYGDKDVWLQAWDNSAGYCESTKQAHVSAIEPIAVKSFTNSTTMTITFNVLGAPINISNVYLEGYDMPSGQKIKQVYLNGTLIYLGNAATMLNVATAQLLNLGENVLTIVGSYDYNATSYFRVQVTSANECGGTAAFEAP
ncbi:PKD domain-containing protein [Candidatus Dependentiae bacterium]|nr:PKD domain-containing protein [Candidatus Dependentiae bacterium]